MCYGRSYAWKAEGYWIIEIVLGGADGQGIAKLAMDFGAGADGWKNDCAELVSGCSCKGLVGSQ